MSELVLFSVEEGVAYVRFNKPERLNALDLAMARAFRAAVDQALDDRRVRAVVLAGEGRAFVSGGDLAYLRAAADIPLAAGELIDVMHGALLRLKQSKLPSIAALKGNVAGAGVSLALMTTLAVAADNATLNLAYIRVAATPDCGGSWALTRLLGERRAAEVALLAETLSAEQALRLGLINRLVGADELEGAVRALALRLAQGPAFATRQTLALIADASSEPLESQLLKERCAFAACAGTRDFTEAVDAFFQKRKPIFEN
ncbi:enoyl-CoA hydratase/isomerase family protein [Terricaulis sp.]|uniref:enoyl-CoA hydratase/isomerase family protein n=1 Tax=Terricaulis sp. TaxID=2768686 RepID=UPI0037846008